MARERTNSREKDKKPSNLAKAATARQGRSTASMAGAPDKVMAKQSRQAVDLQQDPHHVSDKGRSLEAAIGREVRNFRHQLNMTVAQLSVASGMSAGMLSKIENGQTSPSLATLHELSKALQVPVTSFFRGFEEERSATFVSAGQGLPDRAPRDPGRPPVPAARPWFQPWHRGRTLSGDAHREFRRVSHLPA